MLLANVAAALGMGDGWQDDVTAWGARVLRARRYAAGDFDEALTPGMRRLMRVGPHVRFGANYADMVLSAMADRLAVVGMDGADDAATAWVRGVLDANRFDGLQLDVHAAALRDGDTFVMVGYTPGQGVTLSHELAWDGTGGVLPVFGHDGRLRAAAKVWQEAQPPAPLPHPPAPPPHPPAPSPSQKAGWRGGEGVWRVNVYTPGAVQKFSAAGDGALVPEGTYPWADAAGAPLGVALVPFSNRARGVGPLGVSELEGVLPLQDMLNRALYSMTMAAELSAFPVRVARGFSAPRDLTIGMWLEIAPDGMPDSQIADVSTLPQGEIVPYIEQCRFLIEQMYDISHTPHTAGAGASASGEALKQREVGLLSKVRRAQVKLGNAWEDVAALGARVAGAFGTGEVPGVGGAWRVRWQDAATRSTAEIAAVLKDHADVLSVGERLRLLGALLGQDETWAARIEMQVKGER